MTAGGPWVMSAVIGRRAADDGLQLVDELVAAEAGDLVLVIHVVRGGWQGPVPVRVVGQSPTDEHVAQLELDLALAAEQEATGRVVVPLALAQVQRGVYWFEVVVGETSRTRVPLPIR